MTNNNKRLEEQKTQIENMQGQLKRLEGTIKHEYSADLEWIKAQYSKFQVELVKAAETIANKKEEMVASIKREMEFVNRYVKQYEQNLMKDKFVD
jgi:chromosome segregation ATPase